MSTAERERATPTEQVVDALEDAAIVPVLRAPDPAIAHRRVDQVFGAGGRVVELTTTIPDWAAVLRDTAERWPDRTVGLGTVTTADTAEDALRYGAAFLVSPCPVPRVRAVAREHGALLIEGALSPGEVAAVAEQSGMAKVFPASLGGVDYLQSLLQVMPECRLIPSGGIRVEQVDTWLDAGAFAVGVGSDLFACDDLTVPFGLARQRRSGRDA
jgi:2-dehydro-3-deoxyphosphogluconate aldolase/(4S)-4-hydroxy-2-oxoglutarate aldolase